MTLLDVAPATIPTRAPAQKWEVGDVVVIGARRWIIRAINEHTRRVLLVAANTLNHGLAWSTILNKLPEKTR